MKSPRKGKRLRIAICCAVVTLLAFALTNCDRQTERSKTISGEYSDEVKSVDSNTGITFEGGSFYDFRSDGTYSYRHKFNLMGLNQSFEAKGTYKVDGNK